MKALKTSVYAFATDAFGKSITTTAELKSALDAHGISYGNLSRKAEWERLEEILAEMAGALEPETPAQTEIQPVPAPRPANMPVPYHLLSASTPITALLDGTVDTTQYASVGAMGVSMMSAEYTPVDTTETLYAAYRARGMAFHHDLLPALRYVGCRLDGLMGRRWGGRPVTSFIAGLRGTPSDTPFTIESAYGWGHKVAETLSLPHTQVDGEMNLIGRLIAVLMTVITPPTSPVTPILTLPAPATPHSNPTVAGSPSIFNARHPVAHLGQSVKNLTRSRKCGNTLAYLSGVLFTLYCVLYSTIVTTTLLAQSTFTALQGATQTTLNAGIRCRRVIDTIVDITPPLTASIVTTFRTTYSQTDVTPRRLGRFDIR